MFTLFRTIDSRTASRYRAKEAAFSTLVSALMLSVAGCGGGDTGTSANSIFRSESTVVSPSSYWQPRVTDTWQLQLRGTVNTSHPANVYDIDMFDTPVETIQTLKNQGKKVVCYFSAGSVEDWRPDFYKFVPSDMGRTLDGWAGERWADTRSANVRQIMLARMDLAVQKGCDGIDTDNVDGYMHYTGLPLTAATQIDYSQFLAREAHTRGLAISLKNNIELLPELMDHVDFAVNEECHEYEECGAYQEFIARGKPVFNVEYQDAYVNDPAARAALCSSANASQIQTLVLPYLLDDSFRFTCAVPKPASQTVGFGMAAYWGKLPSSYSGQIPNGAYVVINPSSGALGLSQDEIDNFKGVIANIRNQGGKVIGYVPTGYEGGSPEEQAKYAAINSNIQAYATTLGGVDGYFFDEAAFDDATLTDQQKCDGTPAKWDAIRAMVNAAAGGPGVTVWNPGWPGMNGCFVSAARSGEHVVTYESTYANYKNAASWLNGPVQDLANSRGVNTWLLVHSATQSEMQDVLKNTRVRYAYVTSMIHDPALPWGGPIWNSTPTYWGNETTVGTQRWCLKNLMDGGSC